MTSPLSRSSRRCIQQPGTWVLGAVVCTFSPRMVCIARVIGFLCLPPAAYKP